jgi:hypothetical protein
MLRASSEYSGDSVDVTMLRDPAAGANGNLPAAGELLAFASAASSGDAQETATARDQLSAALGADAVVDAAAVIGNFERMTRIADGTGIPLDPPLNAIAAEIQDDLGLREFSSATATKPAGRLTAKFAKLISPLALRLMPVAAKLARRAEAKNRAR